MKTYKKAILPIHFKAHGIACGIKISGKPDLALLYSEIPACACGLFTTNKIQAAPVIIDKSHLKANAHQAIIINSGNANCFTGKKGLEDAKETTQYVADALGLHKNAVLVASTGIIGKKLPLSRIVGAVPELVSGLSRQGIDDAAEAIMTTDTFQKKVTVRCVIGKKQVTLCGIAKGAGMIAPNMACPERSRGATMLCFILTDAKITKKALCSALRFAVDNSFNCITIDGCMSTNDTVIALANAGAANTVIKEGKLLDIFSNALQTVTLALAKMIVRDAEGASKFIHIRVTEAKSVAEAKKAALAIANSNLFKCAMYGEDPNFGRVVASIGASGIEVKEKDLKIKLSALVKKEIKVEVNLARGNAECNVYTSDLTPEYIKINADYN